MGAIDNIMSKIIKFVMAVSTIILSIVTFGQVIARFVFKNPLQWGQDIIRLSFVYLVFWGAAYCVHEKEHLNIDILLTSVNNNARKIIELIINIILALFFIFLIYYGIIFTQSGSSQQAPYLPIPMSIYYVSLPSAAILMLYYKLRLIYRQIVNLKVNDNLEGDLR